MDRSTQETTLINPRSSRETRGPSSVSESDSHVVFEQVSTNLYEISYACLLIPRFGVHYLIGDLADQLHQWMPQICISFGWRLDFLSVNPEYLQWILYVHPTTPPAHFMRIFRQHTSKLIFENFPRIKRDNLSKDFWAPGYLVIIGARPHPDEMINEYVRLTRQQQGYSLGPRNP